MEISWDGGGLHPPGLVKNNVISWKFFLLGSPRGLNLRNVQTNPAKKSLAKLWPHGDSHPKFLSGQSFVDEVPTLNFRDFCLGGDTSGKIKSPFISIYGIPNQQWVVAMKLMPRLISMNNLWFARSMRGKKNTHTHIFSQMVVNNDECWRIQWYNPQKITNKNKSTRFFRVTFWGVLFVTFSRVVGDLHLGDQRVTWKKLANNFVRSSLPSALNSFPSRIRKVQVQTRDHLATGYTVVHLTLKIHHIHCTCLFSCLPGNIVTLDFAVLDFLGECFFIVILNYFWVVNPPFLNVAIYIASLDFRTV